jgi:hypothetical protein
MSNFWKCLKVNEQNDNTLFTYFLNEGVNKILLAKYKEGIKEGNECRLNELNE